MKFLTQAFRYISTTKIFGLIPLDSVLHVVVGAILTILLIKLKIRYIYIFLILLIISVIKEIYDYPTMTFSYREAFIDTALTYAYFCIHIIIKKIRRRLFKKMLIDYIENEFKGQ